MTIRHSILAILVFVALSFIGPRAAAVELGSPEQLASVEVHAFASQGFILSKGNNYLARSTTHGSLEFSEVGINFTKSVTDRLRLGVQLFARDLGPTGNFDAKMDWFYLDYKFADWLGFRAGRVKLPFGLYNEINDIDSARVSILMPQSVYPIQNRDYLLAQTGGELYGYLKLDSLGAIEYRAYAGTIFFDTINQPGSQIQILGLTVPFLLGGRLLWETPLEGLRVGGSLQSLRIDTSLIAQTKTVNAEIPATLWVGSMEYAAHDLLLAAEYSRWYLKVDSSNSTIFPQTPVMVSERAYVMGSYRVAKWFQPGIYYSVYFSDVDHRDGRDHVQHDLATTLRYDINPHWLLKLEGHYMAGTALLDTSLNGGRPRSALDRNWGVFLAKTTAYF
jgi:hypothetical protein